MIITRQRLLAEFECAGPKGADTAGFYIALYYSALHRHDKT